tara:strand:- start:242 stop:709 length:468 start_codon:yes stop_codon:yes gene_type:complete
MSRWNNKIVIFDLDGTLADITLRRTLATDATNGKMDWSVFQDPKNINLDVPNQKVVDMLHMIDNTDKYQIYILSGRSDATQDVTIDWLTNNGINYDHLIMRPQKHLYMADNDLKQMWLDDIGVDNVAMVFDDRQQVVDMWRSNGLTCFQVADGDF